MNSFKDGFSGVFLDVVSFFDALTVFMASIANMLLSKDPIQIATDPGVVLAAIAVIAVVVLRHRHRVRNLRPNSRAQRKALKSAENLYSAIKYNKRPPGEVLEWVVKSGRIDGWAFEIFVLLVFVRSLPNLKYVGDIRLTGDAGIDGVLVTKEAIYIFQSKFYTNYVTSQSVDDFISTYKHFRNRKPKSYWHKVMGVPKRYTRNTGLPCKAVLATTGKISGYNKRRLEMSDVEMASWEELVTMIQST